MALKYIFSRTRIITISKNGILEILPSYGDNKKKMAAKSILEADGKAVLNYHLTRAPSSSQPLPRSATYNPLTKLVSLNFPEDAAVGSTYPWLPARFVANTDQLIKRRVKSGLWALNKTWPGLRLAVNW